MSSSALSSQSPTGASASAPAWQGRSIATQKLRLVDFSAYVEQQRASSGSSSEATADQFNKHMFVQIGGPATYSDPMLEV